MSSASDSDTIRHPDDVSTEHVIEHDLPLAPSFEQDSFEESEPHGDNPDERSNPNPMATSPGAKTNPASTPYVRPSRNSIVREATEEIIAKYRKPALFASLRPGAIEDELIERTNDRLIQENFEREKIEQHTLIKKLSHTQVAQLLIELHGVCTIAASGSSEGRDYDLVAMYKDSGPDAGLYVTSEEDLRHLARQYSYELTMLEFKDVIATIRDSAERKFRCADRDLVAVDNGIFDYRTKTLMPFDPKHVFLSKSRVRYDPDATNPTIFNPDDNTEWDVETWMKSLSDDEGVVDLFWQILGAIVRPRVRWGKAVFLYSESGNNGKGTLCELMRNLCGSYASLSINDMNHEFKLEGIVDKNAIITDENDVGTYIDKAANFKALITNDTILINRKHKSAIKYQFFGLMVQCLNDQPRIKDKSESLYRRQLFVPMTKRFEGIERRYIKADYLSRPEVLEYVLKRVLHTDYYELSEPEVTKQALAEYKMTNDPVREFFDTYEYRFVWDALPYEFLYDAYRAWFSHNVPSGAALGSRTFTRELNKVVEASEVWEIVGDGRFRPNSVMVGPEPLIAELNLSDWTDPTYSGKDIQRRCTPQLKPRYKGIVRANNLTAQSLSSTHGLFADTATPEPEAITPTPDTATPAIATPATDTATSPTAIATSNVPEGRTPFDPHVPPPHQENSS